MGHFTLICCLVSVRSDIIVGVFDVKKSGLAVMSTEKFSVNLEQLANAVPGALYQLQRSPDGELKFNYVSQGVEAIYRVNEAGREIIFGTTQDITDYKELELKLRQTGGSDEQTGFYNRRLMLQSLQRRFSLFQAHSEYQYYVLVVHVADETETLKTASQIVRKNVQDYDIPGHLENGMIVVLMSTLSAQQNTVCLETIQQQLTECNVEHKIALECAQVTDLRFDDVLIRALN